MDHRKQNLTQKAPIHQLTIKNAFHSLSNQEKLYAHHLSRWVKWFRSILGSIKLIFVFSAAWHGTRIILRQVSPESTAIFDFINELYNVCSGQWHMYSKIYRVDPDELESFLEYASTFLSNVGNYYVCLIWLLYQSCWSHCRALEIRRSFLTSAWNFLPS